MKTHVLVINRNTMRLTAECLRDLFGQTVPFKLTLIDNGSNEKTTVPFLKDVLEEAAYDIEIKFEQNNYNVPLNHIWNEFVQCCDSEYICFLNSDVRIPKNFIKDSEVIFEVDSGIGITCHATNSLDYIRAIKKVEFVGIRDAYQGWDYTFRRELFVKDIPSKMTLYGGDKWVWASIYQQQYEGALITSSPIIHYQGQSEQESRMPNKLIYSGLGKYARAQPTFKKYAKYVRMRPHLVDYIIDIDGVKKHKWKGLTWINKKGKKR